MTQDRKPITRRADDSAVPPMERIRKRMTTGLLIAIPALVTVWVIEITLEVLVAWGQPLAHILAGSVRPFLPGLAELLLSDGLRWAVAIMMMLGLFYALGTLTRELTGRRMLERIEASVLAVPGIDLVYGAVRDLIASLKRDDFSASRVVLIEFPGPHMKTVGFVTRLLEDRDSGRSLAAVYVPTTPNPTSGYIEIVPVERLVWLDWTPQEAMRFVVSGGVAGPERISFDRSAPAMAPQGPAQAQPVPLSPSLDPLRAPMPDLSSIQVRSESGAAER